MFDADKLTDKQIQDLTELSRLAKGDILTMTHLAGTGHPGGSMSSLDLYLTVFSQADLTGTHPDQIVVSHGHTSPGAYASLARLGHMPVEEVVAFFRKTGSPFEGHVVRGIPFIRWSTGNLGQGLSAGVGFAIAAKMHGDLSHVYVFMGDGEQQKGQISEARRLAMKYGLTNITALVDYNKLQISGSIDLVMPQNIVENYLSDGWDIIEINGHDYQEIYSALKRARVHLPGVCVYGVKFLYVPLTPLSLELEHGIGHPELSEDLGIGEFLVGLENSDLHNTYPVLLSRAYGDGCFIPDKERGIGTHSRFHVPAEEHVAVLVVGGHSLYPVCFALVDRFGGLEVILPLDPVGLRFLHDQAAVHEGLEVYRPFRLEGAEPFYLLYLHEAQVLPFLEDVDGSALEVRGADNLKVIGYHGLRCFNVKGFRKNDRSAEGCYPVAPEGLIEGLGRCRAVCRSAGVVVLHDGAGRLLIEKSQDIQGIVHIRQVDLPGVLSHLEHVLFGNLTHKACVKVEEPRIAQGDVAVYQFVHRGGLVGVLAIAQTPLDVAFLVGVKYVPDLLFIDEHLSAEVHLDGVRKIVLDDLLVHPFDIFHEGSFGAGYR